MPRPIRVLLEPCPLPGTIPFLVRGCTVGLQAWSAGASKAKVDSPSEASLKFQLRCLAKAQDTSPLRTVDLGEVKGTVALTKLGEPEFTIAEAPTQPNEPVIAADTATFRRSIGLAFRSPEFRDEPDDDVVLLIEEADLEGVRHLELAVALEVAGSEEAKAEVNDVLDIPLKLEFLAVNLVDEVGEPLGAQAVALTYSEEEQAELTTDGQGRVRVNNPPGGGEAVLAFPDESAIRKELETRWSKARGKPRLRPNRAVSVLSVKESFDESDEIVLEPGVRTVSLQPRVELVRFVGIFFQTNKAFLLPSAKAHLGKLQALYDAHPNSTLLIVGHADRAGSNDFNDKLSLERADAVASFLKDDVAGFTKFYASSVPEAKRWGDNEDRAMLRSLDDGADLFATGDPIQAFRDARGIDETGPAGPATRDALVKEYMASVEATLPDTIELVTHGCGENFPEIPSQDGVAEQENRRVELFFFSTGFGVQPAPPGKNSKPGGTAYPEWRRRAQQTHEFDLRLGETRLLRIRLLDGDHEPLAGTKWSILHEFGSENGETDAQGNLVARIPARIESATLVHDLGAVDLGMIVFPPVEEVLGTQIRLDNLGYGCPKDGTLGPETAESLRLFQEDNELDVTGTMDAPTLDKLKEIYGQ